MWVALSLSWWYLLKCKFAVDEVQLFTLLLFFFFAISFLETDYGETHWASSMLTFLKCFWLYMLYYISGLKWEVGCWSQFQVKQQQQKKMVLNL